MTTTEDREETVSLSDKDIDSAVIDQLLASSSDEDEKRNLKKERRVRKRRKKKSFRRGDIVWKLELYSADTGTKIPKVVNDNVLARSALTFGEQKEVVKGELFVVKSVPKRRQSTVVTPVCVASWTSTEDKSRLSSVPNKYLVPFQPDFEVNQKLISSIRRSYVGVNLLSHLKHQEYLEDVVKQLKVVEEFVILKASQPLADPFEYLTVNVFKRIKYKKKLNPNWKSPFENGYDRVESATQHQHTFASSGPQLNDGESKEKSVPNSSENLAGISLKEKDALMADSNKRIFTFFQKRFVKKYLKEIMEGKRVSKRHDILTNNVRVDLSINSKLIRLSNANYLEDDNITDLHLYELLTETVYKPNMHLLPNVPQTVEFQQRYVCHCLIPEGIILSIKYSKSVSLQTAEDIFMNQSCDK